MKSYLEVSYEKKKRILTKEKFVLVKLLIPLMAYFLLFILHMQVYSIVKVDQ